MKKLLILLLVSTLLLCSCEMGFTPNPPFYTSPVQTLPAGTSAIPATTEETVTEPVFEEVTVSTARSYEKQAIDAFYGGAFDFTHKIEYPKINSDKPTATELNEFFASYYDKIINELINNEEDNYLYSISYETSTDDLGIIFIRMIQVVGWQYSESMVDQKIYYYDPSSDYQLTTEEYASMHGIDLERAKENVLYTHELASAYYEDTSIAVSEIGGKELYSTIAGKLYPAKQTEFDFDFYGIEIDGDDLIMHYCGQMYIYTTYEIPLDRTTLAPKMPHYKGLILPNDTTGDIVINFENGIVTNYTLPYSTGISSITVTSSKITVKYTNLKSHMISINGGESFGAGGQMYDPFTGEYVDEFYLNDYIPLDEFKTFRLFVK